MIISGGEGSDNASYTVEAFLPATGQHCQLPNIPAKPHSWDLGPRSGHSMEGLKICSGGPQTASRANCISLTDGTWNVANVLVTNRLESDMGNVPLPRLNFTQFALPGCFTAVGSRHLEEDSWVVSSLGEPLRSYGKTEAEHQIADSAYVITLCNYLISLYLPDIFCIVKPAQSTWATR